MGCHHGYSVLAAEIRSAAVMGMFEVVATPVVARALKAKLSADMKESIERAIEQLANDPLLTGPDQRKIWEPVFPELENHRHVDLRSGWRLCYSVVPRRGQSPLVIVVFLGTHKEYERKYGFKTQ